MNVLRLLDEIGSDTKRSHKLALLESHKDDQILLKVISLALDPYVNFFIKKIPPFVTIGGKSLEWAIAELKDLTSRKVTGNNAIDHLQNILSSISKDDAEVIKRIISKDLRCGMAAGIVNAVIDKHVPTYPCLLARPYSDKVMDGITFPAFSQLKADGVRVNFHIDGDQVTVCGRSGRLIDLLGEMDEYLIGLGKQFDGPVVIDGELVVLDEYGILLERRTGNGIINKGIKGTIDQSEARMVRAQIWDVIPSNEFHAGISSETYDKRFDRLSSAVEIVNSNEHAVIERLKGNVNKVWMIPTRVVDNIDEVQAHFQEMLSIKEEGTIVKNMHGLWEDTRSKHLIKLKSEKECDLEIIGWKPGTGKFTGMVGSLLCASSDQMVEVSISGFPDDLRQEITDDIDSWFNSIITVTYNERIASKDRVGVDSLFLPRFTERRYDKTTADSSDKIK